MENIKRNSYPVYFSIILLFILCTGFNYLKAQDKIYQPVKDSLLVKEKINQVSQQTKTITCDFIQTKRLSFLEEDIICRGRFFFKRENKLRWEYSDPFFYLIIFNNDTILVRDDEKTSSFDASSNRMFKEINDIMLSIINGTILNKKKFCFEYFENEQYYILDLSPHDSGMKDFLEKIRMFFNKNDYSIDELMMIERSGDFTNIKFYNKTLNEKISNHIFDLD